jgi:tetratricopeptide (TPR) repeat protein
MPHDSAARDEHGALYQSLAEEKLLLTCIDALRVEQVLSQADARLAVMRELMQERVVYFQQPGREKKVLSAFEQALATVSQDAGRSALVMGMAGFLSLCGHYVDALLTHIRVLPLEYLPSKAEAHLEMMTELMREHAEYFLQFGQSEKIVEAFDRALATEPQNAGRFALTIGKAEFLKLYRNYEEMLIALISSLPAEYLPSNAERQLKMMRGIVREHTEYFQHIGRGKKLLDTFDRALAAHPQDVARFVLTVGKIELLELYGNYDEVLITHIRALPAEHLSTHAEVQLKMMREVVRKHEEYFELHEHRKRMLDAFDQALAAHPQEAGKAALVTGKAEFLEFLKRNS